MSELGFGKTDELRELEEYVGREVRFERNNITVYGVFIGIKDGYAIFNPSLVLSPGGQDSYLNKDLPSKMLLPVEVIRPLPDGTLEETLKEFYEQKRKQEEKEKEPEKKKSKWAYILFIMSLN